MILGEIDCGVVSLGTSDAVDYQWVCYTGKHGRKGDLICVTADGITHFVRHDDKVPVPLEGQVAYVAVLRKQDRTCFSAVPPVLLKRYGAEFPEVIPVSPWLLGHRAVSELLNAAQAYVQELRVLARWVLG